MIRGIASNLLLVLFVCLLNNQFVGARESHRFSVLTYNVAGLPYGFSSSTPDKNSPLISPKLNDYDIAFFQEDFCCHLSLVKKTKHPYLSKPQSQSLLNLGDGLNQISVYRFKPNLYRETWENCSGTFSHYSDCLTDKGFSASRVYLDNTHSVVMINVHFDAGGELEDFMARLLQAEQLIKYLKKYHKNDALIVTGDWNVFDAGNDADYDNYLMSYILQEGNLIDSCYYLGCGIEMLDRVLYRPSANINMNAISWKKVDHFTDSEGKQLSDHEPVAVEFSVQLRKKMGPAL